MTDFICVPVNERAGLSNEEAAEYIGASTFLFDKLVREGRMPPPKSIYGSLVWSRVALDKAFMALPEFRVQSQTPALAGRGGAK